MNHPEFRTGVFNTGFIGAHPELSHVPEARPNRNLAVVIAAALAAHHGL